MINKKIIFITILLISIFAVSAVSAAENATEEMGTADEILGSENDEIQSTQNDEILSSGGEKTFADLNETINGNTDTEISLKYDYKYTEGDSNFTDGIVIKRNVTVNGNNHTIDGNLTARIFQLDKNNDYGIVFKNINFINGKAYYGGAIYGKCTAVNCTFSNNHAEGGDGGAMDGGSAVNCTFNNNHAKYGGAMNGGSAENCTFNNNTATNDGGAMNYGSAENCTFNNNTADQWGGAMNYGSAENCTFNNNHATYGGAMNGGSAENCTFNNNTATNDGGAMNGGSAVNCTFNNNTATNYGGAMNYGSAENCTFNNNTATNDGGAMYDGSAVNCTFNNNTATNDGGAMNYGSAVNCTFNNNHATYGGAMYYGSAVNCTFNNNHAEYGGAMFIASAENCTFNNNHADRYGSSICYWYNSGSASGCYFVNHTGNKGIIYYTSTSGAVNNNIFLNNSETEIVLDNSNVNTDYNWFGNNASNYKTPPAGNINNWLFLNATINPDNLTVSTIADITFKLYLYNLTSGNISDYDNTLFKNIKLTITQSKGKVDKNSTEMGKSVQYTPTELGADILTAKFHNAKYTLELNNIKIDPGLSVATNDVTYPENATLTLRYNQTATGKVNITLKGKKQKYTFSDIDLNSTIFIGKIDSDEYNMTVTYSGDEGFLNATATATLKVNKGQFKIDANITGVAEGDVKTDQNATVTILNIPTYATGEIIINVSEIGKNYTITLPATDNTVQLDIITTPGTYTLNAQYTGDDNYNASNLVTKTFKVSNWNETDLQTLIDNSTGNVALEHNYTFTNPNATVNVNKSVTINGNGHTIDANGSSTAINITTDNVSVDNMTVSNVNGTGIVSNATNTTLSNVELNNINGTGILTSGDNATIANTTLNNVTESGIISQGENATIDNTEMNSINGTAITTMGDNTSISNTTLNNVNGTGIATSGANTNISNTEMNNINGTGIVSVGENTTISNTSLSNVNGTGIDSNSPNTNINNTTLENVNGTAIQINGDNATVNNVTATNTTGTLIDVTGDNNTISNINATGNSTILVDGKGNVIENVTGATVIPTISATSAVKGNDVIITATVSATEGNVTVQFQGIKYTVPLKDGKSTITIPNVGPGTYENVPVRYDGTSLYQNVSATTSFTSKAAITESQDTSIDYLSGYEYTVRVMNADGTYSAGTAVTFTVNGITYTRTTDNNGYAKLLIELKPKTYTITTKFLNIQKTNKITVKSTLKLVKKTVKVKKTAKKLVLKAKLKWSSGKAIKGKVIKFKFKGKTYKAKTNKKGIAKVTIKKKVIKKLKKGKKYKYWAKYVNEYQYGKVKVKK